MDSDLGVLLALCLKGNPGFGASYQALLDDLARSGSIPKRLSWEGGETPPGPQDLLELISHLPCDFLPRLLGFAKDRCQEDRFGFLNRNMLSTDFYAKLAGAVLDNNPVRRGVVGLAWIDKLEASMGLEREKSFDPLLASFRHIKTLVGHFLPVYCIHFEGTEQRVVSAGDDGIIRVWCLRTGFMVASIRAHSACICDLSIDPRNKYLASCSLDQTIKIWDLETCELKLQIKTDSPVLTVEFHPMAFLEDGRHGILMATCSDGFLRLWPVDLRRLLLEHPPTKYYCKTFARDTIRLASFSNAGARIVTAATDGIVRLLRTPTVQELTRGDPFPTYQPYVYLLDDHTGYVNCMHFAKDGQEMATGAWDGTVRLWRFDALLNTWASRSLSSLDIGPEMPRRGRKVTMVSFCNNDELVLAAVNDLHSLLVFSRADGKLLRELKFHRSDVHVIACHPALERVVVTASYDGAVAVWDIVTGALLFQHRTLAKFLDGAFSPSGDYFALTDDLGRITLLGLGVSPDTLGAPDVQLLHSDWLDPVFTDAGAPIDPIAQRPGHLVPPLRTCDLERRSNPIVLKESFFSPVLAPTWMGSEAQAKQEALLRAQQHSELRLFAQELDTCPPGIAPKNYRSRRRKCTYGSDVEEFDLAGLPLFEDATQQQDLVSPAAPEPSPVGLPEAPILPFIDDDEEEDVYRPSHDRPARRERSRGSGSAKKGKSGPEPSEWLSIDDRRFSPFLPQLYDIVAYFPEGHRMFLEKEDREEFNTDLPPFVLNTSRRSQAHVLAQVVRVEFYVLERPWCQLTLVPVDEGILRGTIDSTGLRADPSDPNRFTLSYYDLEDTPDFVILASRFQWSQQQEDYSVSQLVKVLYGHDEIYNGRITRTGSRRRSPWQCYEVEWLALSDPPEACSPWELEPFEDPTGNFQPYACTEAIPLPVLRFLSEGISHIMESRQAEFLVDPVDYRMFPEYLYTVAYPMDLGLIKRRLDNGFYRRLEAFLWDAQLIPSNALLFNEPDSPIVRDAQAAHQMIENLVRRSQRPMRSSALRTLGFSGARGEGTLDSNPPSPAQEQVSPRQRKRTRILDSDSDEDEPSDGEQENLHQPDRETRRTSRRPRHSSSPPPRPSSNRGNPNLRRSSRNQPE